MRRLVALSAVAILVVSAAVWSFTPSSEYQAPKNDVIVAFGDSLVAGVGSETGGGFVSFLSERIDRQIINLGVPGDTTADGLARLGDVMREDPGIAIVLLGGNDAIKRVPIEETFRNLEAIVTRLQSEGAIVILLGIRGGVLSDPYSEQFDSLAERTGAYYIDNVLSGLITRPELMDDAIHPNDKGYRMIADRIHDTLKAIIDA